MTSFRDLTPIYYHSGAYDADRWQCPALAIGWLEQGDLFPTGACSPELIAKINDLREQFRVVFDTFRGLHQCSMCDAASCVLHGSHVNLFIPGRDLVYVATGRVDHHMSVHGYAPPDEFSEAVLRCPDPRTREYAAAVLALNKHRRPPLFPEKWDIVGTDYDGRTRKVMWCSDEATVLESIERLSAHYPDTSFTAEKAADPWE